MDTKVCRICKEEKDINFFCKDKLRKDGHSYICKECSRKLNFDYKNSHKQELSVYRKKYCKDHKEEIFNKRRENYYKYREVNRLRSKGYYYANRDRIRQELRDNREKENRRLKKYRSENINARIAVNLRNRIYGVLKGYKKESGLKDVLGCNIMAFRIYLESLWTDGMSWDNYNKTGWHIDHIRPCASFDLSDPEQQKQCFHYTNLQPMWAIPNMIKNSWYNGVKYGKKLS